MTEKKRVLVVDDNPKHREAAVRDLSEMYDITVVGTYDEAKKALGAGHNGDYQPHGFAIVLLDLLMPPSDASQVPEMQAKIGYIKREEPVGMFLALMAARGGAEIVGVLTDANHHAHPASAAFDDFPGPFSIGRANVILSNGPYVHPTDGKLWGEFLEGILEGWRDKYAW